jgi:Flp pilus assembly pilin Flp
VLASAAAGAPSASSRWRYVLRSKLQEFVHDESGAAAIEIGLIAAGICVALITLAGQTNSDLRIVFERFAEFFRAINTHAL